MTKMETEINPQKNVLNYILKHTSPEHFKQAPKFGELGPGIKDCSLFYLVPHLEVALPFLNKGVKPAMQKNTHAFLCLRLGANPSCLLLVVWS